MDSRPMGGGEVTRLRGEAILWYFLVRGRQKHCTTHGIQLTELDYFEKLPSLDKGVPLSVRLLVRPSEIYCNRTKTSMFRAKSTE